MSTKPRIAIIGAGPGGLSTAMLLSSRGFDVTIFEKAAQVGGRCSLVQLQTPSASDNDALDTYNFDSGPTILIMKYILEEIFQQSGNRNVDDYLKFEKIDPMYRLYFHEDPSASKQYRDKNSEGKPNQPVEDPSSSSEGTSSDEEHAARSSSASSEIKDPSSKNAAPEYYIDMSSTPKNMRKELRRVFPGENTDEGYEKFKSNEKQRYDSLMPLLQREWSSLWGNLLSVQAAYALPHLGLFRSLFSVLGDYFQNENIRICFTFQAKYLGMSPKTCPGTFGLIPFVEHNFGIHYVYGGLRRISEVMADVVKDLGGKILLNNPVKNIIVENQSAKGVVLQDGTEERFDKVVVNADFGYAANNLFPEGTLKRWTPKVLDKCGLSCGTFTMYLGLDTIYQIPHHNVIFAENYMKNIDGITNGEFDIESEFSIYVCNPSIRDPSMAPDGHSALFILVPCTNLRGQVDWSDMDVVKKMRRKTISILEKRLKLDNLESHIRCERIISPYNWKTDYNVYEGAVFNLAHTVGQMLYWRPHNKFEDVDDCFITGGGTHPGSGLPTIYESGRLVAKLLCDEYGMAY